MILESNVFPITNIIGENDQIHSNLAICIIIEHILGSLTDFSYSKKNIYISQSTLQSL